MSGEPKSLKDALRTFVENLPEDDDLGERPPPKGPNPTTYPGRLSGCGGASLIDGVDPETGARKFKRRHCTNEIAPGLGLCFDCSRAERNMRRDLREAKRVEPPKTRRGFGEDAT